MENATVLTITELVRGGRALTAASALEFSTSHPFSLSPSKSDRQNPQSHPGLADLDPNPKVLTPLNHPSILIGTLALPPLTLNCPNGNCLQFSDDSRTVCCDVLGLGVRAIGKRIRVVAWNFIPLEQHGGFLEIIEWKFLDSGKTLGRCSSLDSFPLVSGSLSAKDGGSKSRYRVHGVLESASPVSTLPCSTGLSGSMNIRGFLVRIMACESKFCSSKEPGLNNLNSVDCGHFFAKPVIVYFCGSAACWHPVMTKLVGCVIRLSGMEKKLVFVGRENSQLMFVTSENSVLHLPKLSEKWLGSSKTAVWGRNECGAYTGIVRGVYMGGMLVELDEEVWLLLTERLLNRPHSLRVGALISVRNAHFLNPKFSWGKMLILGACFKTSIIVESFSPLETGCLIVSYSQSLLRRFIDSLSFPARFWTLLVISCFQKKFARILSEKEILGSSHKEGLAKIYVESHMPLSMFRARHGPFTEFCMHESSICNYEPDDCNLKLVVPILSFIHHNNIRLNELQLGFKKDHNSFGGSSCFLHRSSVWKPYSHSSRKIFLSEEIGVVLMGSLKISSSGRLQLLDRTGSIDVVVPHFPSNWSASSIYEVTDYSLTIEGLPELMMHLQYSQKSFSCRSVFNCDTPTTENTLPMFISFCLSTANCRNVLLYPSLDWKSNFKELEGGTFHIFRVTHKFPVLQNFEGDLVMSKSYTMFAEAVILPWDLICAVGDGEIAPAEFRGSRIFQDNRPSKRRRIADTSSRELISNFANDLENHSSALSISHEIPCLMTIRSSNNHKMVTSGVLCDVQVNRKGDTKNEQNAKKVLLEFSSEEFEKYNGLQIGGCYMIKHSTEDSFCNTVKYGKFNNDKILFNPKTCVWGLDFSFHEAVAHNKSTDDHPSVCNFLNKGSEPIEQGNLSSSSGFCSDISLHLPFDARRLFAVFLKDLEEDLNKAVAKVEETANISETSVSNSQFPEGNLLSLSGDVVAIDCLELCIHVLTNHQTVKIFGSLSRHAYLTGFRPGVNATFYRVLELGGKNMFLLSPVSFVTINSLKVTVDPYMEKSSHIRASCAGDTTSQEKVSAGLISDLVSRCKDNKLISFLCKIVAVHFVVLQKVSDSLSELRPGSCIGIPLAGFVVDDGSSTCCCWAKGERASKFLRLQEEIPQRVVDDDYCIGKDNTWSTIIYHLERIIKKHNRIVVKNYGSLIDSVFQDLKVSVSSDDTLTNSDERFLKFLMLNASNGCLWTVAASKMDTNTVRHLEKEHHVEMEMTKHLMQNAWANKVSRVDPLTEARTMVQDLLNG